MCFPDGILQFLTGGMLLSTEAVEAAEDVRIHRPRDDFRVAPGGVDPVLDVVPLAGDGGRIDRVDREPERAENTQCHAVDAMD
ncbi:hypothetical protein [Streptomyces sp. NBC_01443]|uniref:hypothetical protein n=1 Tax=Streptomyces sp. NBC_01443 TaxID=2903868 RepID=UPI002258FD64|nr:hypothetical protein [Streptomyces sp. NBC_01443]MCX4627096.1 hypothetical protein [Streptomyces sp. NBC_01443]